jgi:hypothetical protein
LGDAGQGQFPSRESSSCIGLLGNELAPEAWFEAAARACHPGAIQVGEAVTKTIDANGPLLLDLPDSVRITCFSAYAIADKNVLPITVELIDDKDQVQKLGSLRSTRNAIPALGPLCSLEGRFRKLKFSAAAGNQGTITLAFFAAR